MLKTAIKAAKAGGKIILKQFGKQPKVTKKPDGSFVSAADKAAEAKIRKIILKKYPDHSVNGEEEGRTGKHSIVWHVDPIDGTTNFKSGIEYCCSSVGVEKGGEFLAGAIYNPFTKEMFYAEKGKGAFLNGKRIRVSKVPAADGLNAIDLSFRGAKSGETPDVIRKLTKVTSRFRIYGSIALELTEVAKGMLSSVTWHGGGAYDFAAGVVIAEEAGAVVTDWQGKKLTSKSRTVVAVNSRKDHARFISVTGKFHKK